MSAHTPPPWVWGQMGGWKLIGNHGMRPIVLGARGIRKSSGPPPPAEFVLRNAEHDLLIPFDPKHPDALLIAAAPEMAALLLSAWQHVSHGGPKRGDVEDVLRTAGLLS